MVPFWRCAGRSPLSDKRGYFPLSTDEGGRARLASIAQGGQAKAIVAINHRVGGPQGPESSP
jgi:hypothetical protein